MHLQNDHQFFEGIELFDSLTSEQLNLLLSVAEKVSFEPYESILKEGDVSDVFYVIQEGYVEVSKIDRNNVNHTVRTLTKKEVIGEIGFLTKKPRSATIQAFTHVKLIKFSIQEIDNLNKSILLVLNQNAAKIVADRLDYAYEIAIEAMCIPHESHNKNEWFKKGFYIVLFLFLFESILFFFYYL